MQLRPLHGIRARLSPIHGLGHAESGERQEIRDGERFAREKIKFLYSVEYRKATSDPLDIASTTMSSIRAAALEAASRKQQQHAIERSKSLVEKLKAHVAEAAKKQQGEVPQRRPSQYEVLMQKAKSFLKVSQQKAVVISDEGGARAKVEVEQFESRKAILKLQLRELGLKAQRASQQ